MERCLERIPRMGYRDKDGFIVLPKEEDYEEDSIYDCIKSPIEQKQ